MNKKIVALIFTVLAFGFTLFGIYRGEVGIVLKKAVNICMECIGIG